MKAGHVLWLGLLLIVQAASAAPVRLNDGSCAIFPNSHWDMDISWLPVHPSSAAIIDNINDGSPGRGMHADFAGHTGTGPTTVLYGIPFVTVDSDQYAATGKDFPPGPTQFYMYGDESDVNAGTPAGRYPFPIDAPIEGAYPGCSVTACNTDRHVLVVDNATCTLYEAWRCQAPSDAANPWSCANGASFNLSNPVLPQRPLGWTSADAAGLPIYPGLIKVDEVMAGEIKHAIRFTARYIRAAYAYPASHLVTNQGITANRPWMGLRTRLSASFNCSTLRTQPAQVICRAMQKYGLILADVGSPWYLTGEASARWETLLGSNLMAFWTDIMQIPGNKMEVVVPPGDCMCTNRACKNADGTPTCPAPCLPSECGTAPPPPANNPPAVGGLSPYPVENRKELPPSPKPRPPLARNPDGSCQMFPGGLLDMDVSQLPLHPDSAGIVEYISQGDRTRGMHADFAGWFGATQTSDTIYYGIPFMTVDSSTNMSFPPGPTNFYLYGPESDRWAGVPYGSGRYPFPADAPVEGAYPGCPLLDCNTDRHVLVVDNATCTLYEGWKCESPQTANAPWKCGCGAAFDMSNPQLPQRHNGFTSADAAGLPIHPLLVKADEVAAGAINHAIRFTSLHIRDAYAYPATHLTFGQGGTGPYRPWMGLRSRLRASFNCDGLATSAARVICRAMQKYGLILADGGSPWFLTGEATPKWSKVIPNVTAFRADMKSIKGVDMEVVVPREGHCLCTIAECITEMGTPMCPKPLMPGQPQWQPYTGPRLVLQTGKPVRRLDGSVLDSYNGTIDTFITTQYYADWNQYQGVTYLWPNGKDLILSDHYHDNSTFRLLLKFEALHEFLPPAATISQALLNLTLVSWESRPYQMQVCALTRPWANYIPKGQFARFTGLGWQMTGLFNATGGSIPWTQPGGWADCDPNSIWSVMVPQGHPLKGNILVSVPIPEAALKTWAASNGSANYGMLIRIADAGIWMHRSQYMDFPAMRPALDIKYQLPDGSVPPDPVPDTPKQRPPPIDVTPDNHPKPPAIRNADGSCAVLPGSHFDLDVSALPVHPDSKIIVDFINGGDGARGMHADFAGHEDTGGGRNIWYGIPFTHVDSDPAKGQQFSPGPTDWFLYPWETDVKAGVPAGSGRYPFPEDAPIELSFPGCKLLDCNSDRHVLVVDDYTCMLYEAYKCEEPVAGEPWNCGCGASFNLSNPLLPQRPLGWTSADAAGLPIYAGLIRYDEVAAGAINHAIRFTSRRVRPSYAYPATHLVTGRGINAASNPWMGMRTRLRAGFNCNALKTREARIICTAMKKYGLILADVGSSWFLTGEAKPEWETLIADLDTFRSDMKTIKGIDMEVVVPPGHCICTNAQCINPQGVRICLPPETPAEAAKPKPQPTGTLLVVQTGLDIPQLDGTKLQSYNGTIDAGITTQYIASWNNFQGVGYFWPTTNDRMISDAYGSEEQRAAFRTLLRFNDLHLFLPPTATINRARLNLTFVNWDNKPYTLQMCAVQKRWVATAPVIDKLKSLGWAGTGVLRSDRSLVTWTQPGGWADCAEVVNFTVPMGYEKTGNIQVYLDLPPSLVSNWAANCGQENYGLLFRADAGGIALRSSQHAIFPSIRPLLEIYYTPGSYNFTMDGYPSCPSPSPEPLPVQSSPSPTPAPATNESNKTTVQLPVTASPSPAPIKVAQPTSPAPRPAPMPPSVVGNTIVIQTGRVIKQLDGVIRDPYNQTQDAAISTQYIDAWNNYQGNTYFWPDTPEIAVGEGYSGGSVAFRAVMRFGVLDRIVDIARPIKQARLNLTFVNWDAKPYTLQVCALNKKFLSLVPPVKYSGLGWQSTGQSDGAGKPINWTQPGGWADCNTSAMWNVTVPGGSSDGVSRVTLPIPNDIISTWSSAREANNYGLLMRADGGALKLRGSQYKDDPALNRPALEVEYVDPSTLPVQSSPSPSPPAATVNNHTSTAPTPSPAVASPSPSTTVPGGTVTTPTPPAAASPSPVPSPSPPPLAAVPSPSPKPPSPSPKAVVVASPSPAPPTVASPSPKPPSPPSPAPAPAPATFPPAVIGNHIIIQPGRVITRTDGVVVNPYNNLQDAAISTQYIDAWNNYQGNTYFWPDTPEILVGEGYSGGTVAFRAVMRFGLIDRIVDLARPIKQAQLNLTFINWDSKPYTLQVCALTLKFLSTVPPVKYSGLGWAYRGQYDAAGKPLPWTQPGGWADCNSTAIWPVQVPGGAPDGLSRVTVPISNAVISSWISTRDTYNFGLLLKAEGGALKMLGSQYKTDPVNNRPALDIEYA